MSKKTTNEPAGEYYLQDVPDLESGFRLDQGHGFQFFLSYGALDRYGSGQWQQDANDLVFQSRAWPGKDFALLESKTTGEGFVTVRIIDKNEKLLPYVAASVNKGLRGTWQAADPKGYIRFPKQEMKDIMLISEFCPERSSFISIGNPLHNYFGLRFEPWIMEYFFNDFRLSLTGKGLKGKHPMLVGDNYLYKKRTNKL